MKKLLGLKKVISLVLAVSFMATTFIVPASAADSYNPTLLKSETIVIDGIEVRFDKYQDEVGIVETATIIANSNRSTLPDSLHSQIISVADQRMEEYNASQQAPESRVFWKGDVEFHNAAYSDQNSDCYAGHWGFWTAQTMSPFYIKLHTINSRALYGGTTANKLEITDYLTYDGLAVSISWPPSFSGTSQTRNSPTRSFNNTTIATATTPPTQGSSLFSVFSLTFETRTDIYIGNESFATSVSDTSPNLMTWDW